MNATAPYYSRELCEHHKSIITGLETDLRCASTMNDANAYQLEQANRMIKRLTDELASAQVFMWLLPAASFLAGICLMALVCK